jgi:hypothetical protein
MCLRIETILCQAFVAFSTANRIPTNATLDKRYDQLDCPNENTQRIQRNPSIQVYRCNRDVLAVITVFLFVIIIKAFAVH